jgi:biofilm PGA synthesis protein PgaA
LAAGLTPWERRKGYREPEQNPDDFSADLVAGLDRLYRNELELAEQMIGDLYLNAPRNSELRKALGDVQSARRRPRAAQRLFEQGLAVEPKHPDLQAALADSFLLRRQWRLAEKSIARLHNLYPDEGTTLRLQDEWQRRNLRILEGRVSLGIGDSPSVAGRELDFLLRGWTRPLDYDWRLGAFIENRRAKLQEGDAVRTYVGGAFQRLSPDWSWLGQLGLADVARKPWSAELTGRYQPKDHWAAYFGLSRNGKAVALRALESGTGGNELLLGGEWWRHESLSASLEFSLLDYDDGNLRGSLSGSLRKRLRTGPTLMLDNIVRVTTTGNSQSGGFYFAPEADLLIEDELQLHWISWRWYADTFTQRASFSTGGYWQQNYGLSVPFGISYAHEWELLRRRLLIEYGPSISLNYYDGDAEAHFGLYLAFTWRY